MANKPGVVSIVRRDKTLRLTVTSDIYERLENLAVTVGVPPATLATVAVGFYVSNQERALGAVQRMMDKVGAEIGSLAVDEGHEQLSLLTKTPR